MVASLYQYYNRDVNTVEVSADFFPLVGARNFDQLKPTRDGSLSKWSLKILFSILYYRTGTMDYKASAKNIPFLNQQFSLILRPVHFLPGKLKAADKNLN